MTARVVPDGPAGWAEAVEVLHAGGIVALPTDTVYGICVALETSGGVERLFAVKRRPPDKGIILLLEGVDQAAGVGVMTPAAVALTKACWPGGLTVVVPQRPDVALPGALTAGTATIGLRVPDHATPRALAGRVGPLPTTSANVSGLAEARDAGEIEAQLGGEIDLIVDGGPAHGGAASTVIDCSGPVPRILRPGAVSLRRIGAILDEAGLAHEIAAGPDAD